MARKVNIGLEILEAWVPFTRVLLLSCLYCQYNIVRLKDDALVHDPDTTLLVLDYL